MQQNMMQQVLLFATLIMPLVTALVELVKRSLAIRKHLLPIIALVIGLLIGCAAYPFTDMTLVLRLWASGFAGLAATGLFELMRPNRKGTI